MRRTNPHRLCSMRTEGQSYSVLTLGLHGCSASAMNNNTMERLKCPGSQALTRLPDLRGESHQMSCDRKKNRQQTGGPRCLVTEVTRDKFAISISSLFLTNEKLEHIIRGIAFENRAK